MSCDIPDLLTYLLRGKLVSVCGLGRGAAAQARIDKFPLACPEPAFASVLVTDATGHEREVRRIADIDDLNRFIADTEALRCVASEVRRAHGE
jgi:hypothetical protein